MDFLTFKQRQSYPLELKIKKTIQSIREWYNGNDGNVYVSFSGGKDSCVLLHIVRSVYPNIKAIFINTGLEYPEIVKFVNTFENITILHPKKTFKDVIDEYGYPIISKNIASYIDEYRNSKSEKLKNIRLNGNINKVGKISEKWKFLINAPFKISGKCCEYLKKKPAKDYERKTGFSPFLGTLACESNLRQQKYLEHGCNAFNCNRPYSMPLGFWTEQDILEYIYIYKIEYCKELYGDIIMENKEYKLTGMNRTGCMFCMFGIDKDYNRFEKFKDKHPRIYNYCINTLKVNEIIDYIKKGINK